MNNTKHTNIKNLLKQIRNEEDKYNVYFIGNFYENLLIYFFYNKECLTQSQLVKNYCFKVISEDIKTEYKIK